jgi:hypothetical protein
MHRVKKAFFFLLGLNVVPYFLGALMAKITGVDDFGVFAGFFLLVYLGIYFSFPHIYTAKMQKRFPNKYLMYAVLYAGIFVVVYLLLMLLGLGLYLSER